MVWECRWPSIEAHYHHELPEASKFGCFNAGKTRQSNADSKATGIYLIMAGYCEDMRIRRLGIEIASWAYGIEHEEGMELVMRWP